MKASNTTIINSWNEWDPLKHVILGRVDKTSTIKQESENPLDLRNWGNIFHTIGPDGEEHFELANEQIEGFATLLEKRNIRVDRPSVMDFSQAVQTPDWVHNTMFGVMPPRDLLICFGNEILETTMSFRDRWYEYLCPTLPGYKCSRY